MNTIDRNWSFEPPETDKAKFLSAVEQWLGGRWLEKQNGHHPMQRLWQRRDWLSSAELFTIGWALTNQEPVCNSDWFVKTAHKIKNNPLAGERFELIAAAMLNNRVHDAHLTVFGEQGSDIRVRLPNKTVVNVSCKALSTSESNRQFRAAAKTLVDTVVAAVGSIQTRPQVVAVTSTFRCADTTLIKEIIDRLGHPQGSSEFSSESWTVRVDPLPPMDPHLVISTHVMPSYHVIVASPFDSGEQRRFENLFRQAATNLKKHHSLVSPTSINMVMIKLPESVSLDTAATWLDNQFSRIYSSITAVLLYRTGLRRDDGGFFISHEVFLRNNPHAKITWSQASGGLESLHLKAPIGKLSAGDPIPSIRLGDSAIMEGPMYLYRKALIHYELDWPIPTGTNVTLSVQPDPSIETRLVFHDTATGECAVVSRNPRHLITPDLEML